MPKSKNYNKWVEQNYPRKCEHCDYVSNNPAMYSYHKKTHEPIPAGQLCHHGCGNLAEYRGTGGKFTCTKVSQQCPAYIKKHSNRVREQWKRDGSEERKKKTKEVFLRSCALNPESIAKMTKTKQEQSLSLSPEEAMHYQHYARRVRAKARKWAKSQGYVLGKECTVDHRFSVFDAWNANLNEDIVNHPANLEIMPMIDNSKKGSNSSITLEELMNLLTSSQE